MLITLLINVIFTISVVIKHDSKYLVLDTKIYKYSLIKYNNINKYCIEPNLVNITKNIFSITYCGRYLLDKKTFTLELITNTKYKIFGLENIDGRIIFNKNSYLEVEILPIYKSIYKNTKEFKKQMGRKKELLLFHL